VHHAILALIWEGGYQSPQATPERQVFSSKRSLYWCSVSMLSCYTTVCRFLTSRT